MKNLIYVFVVLVCSFLFYSHSAFAGSCTNNTTTSWNDPTNWTGTCTGVGGVPGTGDTVTISNPVDLNIASPVLASLAINSTLTVLNSLNTNTLSIGVAGTLTANANTITISGTSGTLFTLTPGGVFTSETSTVTFSGNGSAILNSGSPTFYNMNSSGTGTKSLGAPITISHTFTISNGTFDTTSASHYGMNIGFFIMNGGTFTPQSSIINLTETGGSLVTYNAGTFTPGTSTFIMTGNGTASLVSGGLSFYNVSSSGTGTKSAGGVIALTSGGTLSITNGTFNPSGGITMVGSNTLSVTNATIQVPTAFAVDYNSSGISTITLGAGSTVDYVEGSPQTIDNSLSYVNLTASGGSLKTLAGTTNVSGNLIIGSGATIDVTTSNFALTVGGNWQNSGTFTPRSGTVTWTGTNTNTVSGSTTFYDLAITGTPKEIYFPAGVTQTFSHSFTATGTAGNLTKLYSATPGTKWIINSPVSSTASYIDIKDGGCQSGSVPVLPTNSGSNGNNDSCWTLASVPLPQQHSSSGGGGSYAYKPLTINPLPAVIQKPITAPFITPLVPSCTITKILKKGTQGDEVLCLQRYLQSHNYFPSTITPNGFFGPQTKSAVINFQKAMNLSADGIVGKKTGALIL